jgi:sulfide:quinone oxidoreductase
MGGGVAGHTAASFIKKWLDGDHEVIVVTPNSKWNWIPSNIWVGVGEMSKKDVIFPLSPVYRKAGIDYRQAKAMSIHPEGDAENNTPYIIVEYTGQNREGEKEKVYYDYLVNATGPKLDFDATPGLGNGKGHPGANSVSVCTADHAVHASSALKQCIEKMRQGQKQILLIGMGHGTCTCQGAAFEYIFNIEHKLREEGVREQAELIFITNESFLGDFGMGGLHFKVGGYIASSKIFAESLYSERGIDWITGAHVTRVEKGKITYETLDGETDDQNFDFAMLIPPFSGVGLKAYAQDGEEITGKLFLENGFMKVDADYSGKPYGEWEAEDWPRTLQNPDYPNIFAIGIAFAPPHLISKPMTNPNGTVINPTPPRTGMPSAMMGKAVAASIRDMINGSETPTHTASMAEMGAACVASAGKSLLKGTAAAITVYPIVPDFGKYPGTGRDIHGTTGEIGLAAHWVKHILHHVFIWKAKLKPGWTLIPE